MKQAADSYFVLLRSKNLARECGAKCKQLITAMLLLAVALSAVHVNAQETAPPSAAPPKSPEVQRLEEEKTKAELRKAIAEANKAELDAKFPKPVSTPLEGKTTINDNAIIESQMIAYVSMARAANRIVKAVKQRNLPIGNLAIYNERDVNLLLSYKVATGQVEALRKQFCDYLPCPLTTAQSLAPLSVAQSFLGGFVDLTAFFRTNVEIKGQTFDIDEGPLVAEVFRAARRADGLPPSVGLYYPYVFPPDIDPLTPSTIVSNLEQVRELRIEAARFISDVADMDQDIAKVKAKIEQLKASIELLMAKERDAIIRAKRILETYCPKLARESSNNQPPPANASPSDRLDYDAENILDKIRQVQIGKCRTIPAEKREALFEIRDVLRQTISDKRDATTKLAGADRTLTTLEQQRKALSNRLADPSMSVDDAVAFLKAASEQFDKFVTSIIQADAAIGVNPLTSYIRAEKLKAALGNMEDSDQPGRGYWLQLKVLKAGGNNRIKTNLIVDIFTAGNRISHSGGTIVQYSLYNSQGQVMVSDTITEYTNYIKANKVKNLPCSRVDNFGADGKDEDCLDEVRNDSPLKR